MQFKYLSEGQADIVVSALKVINLMKLSIVNTFGGRPIVSLFRKGLSRQLNAVMAVYWTDNRLLKGS